LYKLHFTCDGITKYKTGITNIDQLRDYCEKVVSDYRGIFLWSDRMYQKVPDEQCLRTIIKLAKFCQKYKEQIRVRVEYHWCSVYTNDPAILNDFLKQTEIDFLQYKYYGLLLNYISVPSEYRTYDNQGITYKKKLPYNKYHYKVTLSTSKKPDYIQRGNDFFNWASQMEQILIPPNAADSLLNPNYAYGSIYFYCIDEDTLNMARFLLGQSIKTVEHFELFDK